MYDRFRRFAAQVSVSLLLLVSASAEAAQVAVADELERLAEAHGFTLIGVEQTEDAFGRADSDELYPRLRRLLENFDHVIVQSPTGIDRVIILGEKAPFVPAPTLPERLAAEGSAQEQEAETDIVVETIRRGTQHAVRVHLEGKEGKRVEQTLLVDTGADYVVLPSSVAKELGLETAGLSEREMQTANGKVKARIGTLPALWLGPNRVAGVQAAFIEGGKLGGNGLLGMSFLGRYRMTIDDESRRLTLGSKAAGAPPKEAEAGAEEEPEAGAEDPGDKSP
ncbi:MAG: retropepsin-like aspartic protease [Pseudomonadota bacterium]|nr:retropepsin-like aspartic protease [Pseudomonadota bacterium]